MEAETIENFLEAFEDLMRMVVLPSDEADAKFEECMTLKYKIQKILEKDS